MRKRMCGTAVLLVVATAGMPPTLTAQERRAIGPDLPPRVAQEVVDFLNDTSTLRLDGRARVPAGRALVGDVGALGGSLTLGGRIEGDLVVVNGDLVFEAGGLVEGDVTVVGGEVLHPERGVVRGATHVYHEGLRYVERDGGIEVRRGPPEGPGEGGWLWGRTHFTVKNAGSYSRVEGLPVHFGPVLALGEESPFRLEALARWRSESGPSLRDEELGWMVRGEQGFAAIPGLAVGATLHSTIEPISRTGVSDLESSLSTFLFHKDFQDFAEREGWSAWARARLGGFLPLALTLEFRDEKHAFAPVSSPWTLPRNDDPWRPQPLVGEGDLQTVVARLALDSRNDLDHPTDGWWMRLDVTRGVGGDLALPSRLDPLPPDGGVEIPPTPVTDAFTSTVLDARRYNRLGPDSELAFRFFYGGLFGSGLLPPQYQHALGGEGSLPGYGLFSMDCGARRQRVIVARTSFDDDSDRTQPAHPYFGCDRALLVQVEYRGSFGFDLDFAPAGEDWDWYPVVDLTPSWVAFADLGQGWSADDETLDTGARADVGAGLFVGDLGFFLAMPLQGEHRKPNFFVRLQRRF